MTPVLKATWLSAAILGAVAAPACSGDQTAPPAGPGATEAGAGGAHDAAAAGTGGSRASGGARPDAARDASAGGEASGGRGGSGGSGRTGGSGGTGGASAATGGAPIFDGAAADGTPEAGPLDGGRDAEGGVCAPPRVSCSGACTDLSSDSANCGACGHTCSALEACLDGACTTAHCGPSLRFVAEPSLGLAPFRADGGTITDAGIVADGGADAAVLVSPNRVVLAPSASGGTMDAWIATSGGVYRALGGGVAALLSFPALVLPGASQAIAVAKLDGDGLLDVADDTFTDVALRLGNAQQTFPIAGTIAVGGHEGSVLAVDIDGDQVNEIVVAALITQESLIGVWIYKVPPFDQPSLWRSHLVPLGGSADVYGLAAGNFDHDGYRDLALAAYGTSTAANGTSTAALVTFANTPSELSDPVIHVLPSGRVRTPLVFDFDRDGFDDVIAVAGPSIHFFAGSAAGLPVDPVTTSPEKSFTYADAAAADFDRDAKIDLALVRRIPPSDTEVVPAWGDGRGNFSPDFSQAVDLSAVSGIVAGDVNDDGRPDLVTVSADRGSVTAVRNECN